MSTPDNNKNPIEEVQELTDENLEGVSGGIEYSDGFVNTEYVLDNRRALTAEAQITPPA